MNINDGPEPCLSRHCRSPLSCAGWGYCRQRNMEDPGAPTERQIQEPRSIASARNEERPTEARWARSTGPRLRS